MKKILLAISFTLFFCAGCNDANNPKTEKNAPKADKKIIIGLLPERNLFHQLERYDPLAKYISNKLAIGIELKILPRYGNIINNYLSENMDGAFLGSFTYALAHSKLGVEVIARPENTEGISTYHGLIFVRKDSGIKSIKDMAGKRFAFVDKATTAGYLLPLAYFKKNGIDDYRRHFKETYFAGTHEDVIHDVLNGKADIGAAKNTMFYRLAEEDRRILNDLTIIEMSPDVPENGLAMGKNIDQSVKIQIKDVLLGMNNEPAGLKVLKDFGASRFIPTTDDDYKPVMEYVKEIGLDLSTYDYLNE